ILRPPSTAPFIAPKTRAPVVVRINPVSSQEQTSAISRCIVGKTNFNSIFWKFMAVSSTYNPISFNS
ncbi:hypothetical protein ALC62_06961, partial [Cyphomyrmex costatus]